MDPKVVLKRSSSRSIKSKLCIICECLSKEHLSAATTTGLISLQEATCSRRKLRDLKNRETMDRVDNILSSDKNTAISYHKSCFSTYTSKERISRLCKTSKKTDKDTNEGETSHSCCGADENFQ